MCWVFGYGSLMWRPGFDHRERHPATLHGWQRAFCRYSLRHRGTPQAPGMVVGLAPSGFCRGYAYRVETAKEAEMLAYLDDREGAGYHRVRLPIEIDGNNGAGDVSHAESWVYVPDESHPSHAKNLERRRIVQLIATGHGQSGTAHNYLIALIRELERLGAADPDLYVLLREVQAYKREHGTESQPIRPPAPEPPILS